MEENGVGVAVDDGVHLRFFEFHFEIFRITADEHLSERVSVHKSDHK